MFNSFLYRWVDCKTGKFYIGYHKGKEDDGYISSSKYFNEEFEKRPLDFTRHIISRGLHNDIKELETYLLTEVNAAKNPMYFNKHNGGSKFCCTGHTEESKLKMKGRKAHNKGISNPKQSELFKNNNPMKNPEVAKKSSLVRKGIIPSNKGIITNIPAWNRVTDKIKFVCEQCGKESELLNLRDNRAKRFCNKSCAATWYNLNGRKYNKDI